MNVDTASPRVFVSDTPKTIEISDNKSIDPSKGQRLTSSASSVLSEKEGDSARLKPEAELNTMKKVPRKRLLANMFRGFGKAKSCSQFDASEGKSTRSGTTCSTVSERSVSERSVSTRYEIVESLIEEMENLYVTYLEQLGSVKANQVVLSELRAFDELDVGQSILRDKICELPNIINESLQEISDLGSRFHKVPKSLFFDKAVVKKLIVFSNLYTMVAGSAQKLEVVDKIIDEIVIIQKQLMKIKSTYKMSSEQSQLFLSIYDVNDDPKSSLFFQNSFLVCMLRRTLFESVEQSGNKPLEVYPVDIQVTKAMLHRFDTKLCQAIGVPTPHIRILSALRHLVNAMALSQNNTDDKEKSNQLDEVSIDDEVVAHDTVAKEQSGDKIEAFGKLSLSGSVSPSDSVPLDIARRMGFTTEKVDASLESESNYYLLPEEKEALTLFMVKSAVNDLINSSESLRGYGGGFGV